MEPTPPTSSSLFKKQIPIIFTLIPLVLLVIAGFLFFRHQSLSGNILDLTSPVTSFSGTIKNISGDTFTISGVVSSGKTLAYQVTINANTPVDTTNVMPGQANPALSAKDLQKGMFIIVRTKKDLRVLSGSQFEASSVEVSVSSQVQGIIDSVSGNNLTIKTPTPPIPLPGANEKSKSYSVLITSNTQITKTVFSPPEPPKLESGSISDLVKGGQVTVYTNEDLESSPTLSAKTIIISVTQAPTFIPPLASSSAITRP